MLTVSAPGKLFLSGEWAVLELGNPGIITAVNRRVYASIEESEHLSLRLDDFDISVDAKFDGNKLKWKREVSSVEERHLVFIKAAIESAFQYLGESKPFSLRSWGENTYVEIDNTKKKVGLGSSAAAVVSAIAGILKFNGIGIGSNVETIYKLAAIAHYSAQGKVGSAFDVAASTYGGCIVYKRFDPAWLMKEFESGKSVRDIVEQDWPGFYVEKLGLPEDFILLVAWTKESASTSEMVKALNRWAKNNRNKYDNLFNQIAVLVEKLIDVWKAGNKGAILELLRKNELYLRELGESSGVNIESPELKLLSEIANRNGGAGKLSGAGGGDCGIAVCFEGSAAESIKREWKESGLHPLDVEVSREGVRVER